MVRLQRCSCPLVCEAPRRVRGQLAVWLLVLAWATSFLFPGFPGRVLTGFTSLRFARVGHTEAHKPENAGTWKRPRSGVAGIQA